MLQRLDEGYATEMRVSEAQTFDFPRRYDVSTVCIDAKSGFL